jgi:small-conductance mechanosensitive channel
VNRNIWRLFTEHGISIPFPQREVRVVGLPEGFGFGATGVVAEGSPVSADASAPAGHASAA